MIYLDNAATTQIDQEVLDAMLPYLRESYGNPGALYSLGRDAKSAVEKAREQVARFLNCEPNQIIFTSGGSEGNNLVISGVFPVNMFERMFIASTGVEHDSILNTLQCYRAKFFDPLNAGTDLEREGFLDDVYMVSAMYMNNETGNVFDVKSICDTAHSSGALFHTDCVQAAASMPVDVADIGCDFATISSHKLHGPKGVGAVFVKDMNTVDPIICGGSEQEFGKRGGTENVAGIVGFGKACELMTEKNQFNRIYSIKNLFVNMLESNLSRYGMCESFHINGGDPESKILNVRFDGIDAQTLVLMLDSRGVCISAGSACRSHESVPSAALIGMGLTEDEARSSVRVSFSRMNTFEEACEASRIIADCVKELKEYAS